MTPSSPSERKWMKAEYDKLPEDTKNRWPKFVCPYCKKEKHFDTINESPQGTSMVCVGCITKFDPKELEQPKQKD